MDLYESAARQPLLYAYNGGTPDVVDMAISQNLNLLMELE